MCVRACILYIYMYTARLAASWLMAPASLLSETQIPWVLLMIQNRFTGYVELSPWGPAWCYEPLFFPFLFIYFYSRYLTL